MNLLSRLKQFRSKNLPSSPQAINEPVVGWRAWALDNGKLKSVFTGTAWEPRKPLWSYNYDGQTLGIHCWKTQGQAFEYAKGVPGCYGPVYLWGKIAEHEEGYLAEFAYPKALVMLRESDPLTIMELEWDYGVSVTIEEEFMIPRPTQGTTWNQVGTMQNVAVYFWPTPQQSMAALQQQQMQHYYSLQMQNIVGSPSFLQGVLGSLVEPPKEGT